MKYILLLLLLVPLVAAEIEFTANSEYFVLLNQPADIQINVTNPYGVNISGTLANTISQSISTGSGFMQSSSSNSQPYIIDSEQTYMNVNLGTSSQPAKVELTLKYTYLDDQKEQFVTNFGPITIHFVEQPQEQQQEQTQSQTQSQEELQKQQEEQRKKQEEQRRQEEERRQKEREEQNKLENRLQNNQQHQDTQALKNQIQQEVKDQKSLNQEFENQLEQNQDIQKQLEQLQKEGFQVKNTSHKANTNSSGEFEYNLQKGNQTAQISGKVENNSLTELQTNSQFTSQHLIDKLEKNETYNQLRNQLETKNFTFESHNFTRKDNQTIISSIYKDQNNKTKVIQTTFDNDSIENIHILSSKKWILIVLILLLATYFFIPKSQPREESQKIHKKELTPKQYATNLLRSAKKAYKTDKKQAYSLASQAGRYYISHKYSDGSNITTYEATQLHKTDELKECFSLTNLVTFAQYKPNSEDFSKIIKLAQKIIK